MSGPDPLGPVRQWLDRFAPGTAPLHRHAPRRTIAARREFLRMGEMPTSTWAIRSGWAAMVRHLPSGRRQIQHLLLPGDPVLLARRAPSPSTVQALTAVTLVAIDCPDAAAAARIDHALAQQALDTTHYLLSATVRLGRQVANERLAHLLLEVRDRLMLAGEGGETRFDMPLTQEMLADTLGLTNVHINRTLQAMRQQELLAWRGGTMELLQPHVLEQISDYVRVRDAPQHRPWRVATPA